VVVVDYLVGDSTMLVGAKALKETARRPAVWVHPADAGRLGLADGAEVAVVGSAGRLVWPVRATSGVLQGCVVLPGNSSGQAPGLLGGSRVRLEPVAGTGGDE
jgi:anaerobic selenocysteine-containing dehydrogenase